MKNLILIALMLMFSTMSYSALAYVMESSNYRIQQDSINFGGTEDAGSANYKIRDTLGEVGTGFSSSDSYNLYAGYRQMNEVYLSINSPSDITLLPNIGGITGGVGDGSAVWTVITDNAAGYTLTIKASSSPALVSGDNFFTDYIPVGSNPDFAWSVAAADSEFGFTPEGSDIVQKYMDDTSTNCNAGSSDTPNVCWYGLSTSAETIAQSSSANHPSGTATTIKFRAESGSSHVQMEGTYTATTTVTALAL